MKQPRKALGRGFSALLQPMQDIAPEEVLSIKQLEIQNIEFNPWQPRSFFDPDQLENLAQSIRVKGVIQPILVRVHPTKPLGFELIAGERRLRASKLAGFLKIPAIVKDYTDRDILEVALIENIQRSDLNPLEESLAYRNLIEQHGYTQEELAKRVGKSRSTITNMIRLLNLPKSLQSEVAQGKLTPGHARCLLAIQPEEKQLALARETIEKELSVRTLELRIQQNKAASLPQPKGKNPTAQSFEPSRLKLEERLKTSVKIKLSKKGGKIELCFADQQEFNRLLGLLTYEQP